MVSKLALAVALVAGLGPGSAEARETSGVVLNPEGRVLEGAVVRALACLPMSCRLVAATADARGAFAFSVTAQEVLFADAYVVAPGVPAQRLELSARMPLSRPGPTTTVRLRDERGRPAVGARVVAWPVAWDLLDAWAGVVVGEPVAPGEYALEGLGGRPYRIVASAAGGDLTATATASAKPLDLTLRSGGAALIGRVQDPAGKPVAGGLVALVDPGPTERPQSAPSLTDADGIYRLSDSAGGPRRLLVVPPAGVPVMLEVALPVAGEARADVTIRGPGRLRLVLLGFAGKGIRGRLALPVSWQRALPAPLARSLETTGVGRLDEALPLGDLQLVASAAGHQPVGLRVTVLEGRTTDVGAVQLRKALAIRGVVRDPLQRPAAGARLRLYRAAALQGAAQETSADARGAFSFEALATGLYEVVAEHEGAEGRAFARAGGEAEITLAPPGGVTGTLKAEAPVELVARRVEPLEPAHSASITIPAAGRFRVAGLVPGRYVVSLRGEGLAPIDREPVLVRAGRDTDIGTLSARSCASLTGRVLDRDGQGVEGARVEVRQGQSEKSEHSDVTGAFVVTDLADDALEVRVEHPDFAPHKETLEAPSELEVVLDRGGRVEGRVATRSGVPRPGRSVQLMSTTRTIAPPSAITDESGAFAFQHVPAGPARLALQAAGRDAFSVSGRSYDLVVAEDETTRVDVLDAEILLQGVVHRGSAPLDGAVLRLQPRSGSFLLTGNIGGPPAPEPFQPAPLTGISRADGSYALTVPEPGSYGVRIESGEVGSVLLSSVVEVPDQPVVFRDFEVPDSQVHGFVLDSTNRQALAQAEVGLRSADAESRLPRGRTGPDGYFSIAVPAGTYAAEVRARGYLARKLEMDASPDPSAPPYTVELDPGGELTGRVLDETGRPAGGALVTALSRDHAGERVSGVTSLEGRFVLSGVHQEMHDLVIRTGTAGLWAEAVPGEVRDYRLRPVREVVVSVVGPAGEPRAGARVTAWAGGQPVIADPGLVTGESGTVTLVLPDESVVLRARSPDGGSVVEIEVPAGMRQVKVVIGE